jgi:uncharacterized membrane protein
MTSRTRLIILSLALIGIGFASASMWFHFKLLTDASYISPCDVNETFNCSQVYLSPYGSVRGVPVALGGVVWFGLVGLIAWFANTATTKHSEQPSGAYVFALSTIGLAVVLSLGYTSTFVLKTYCLLCLGTYASVIGIFIASGMTSSVPMMSLPGRVIKDIRNALGQPAQMTAGLVYLIVIVAAVVFFPGENTASAMASSAAPPKLEGAANASATPVSQDPKVQFEAWWNAQRRVETGVALDGAKVVVVKFSDFQCPGCKQTWLMYTPVLDKYLKESPAQVRYVMKDFPLNSSCNVSVQTQMHPFACEASVAYRAAVDRGKGREMEEWIFNNQAGLNSANIRAAAKTVAGIDDFERQIGLKTPGIRKDTSDGGALQINSTPTFFINGVMLPTGQWLNPEFFDLAIQIELKRAGAAAPQKAGGN